MCMVWSNWIASRIHKCKPVTFCKIIFLFQRLRSQQNNVIRECNAIRNTIYVYTKQILSFKTCDTNDPLRNSSENLNFFVVGIFSQTLCITFLINLQRTQERTCRLRIRYKQYSRDIRTVRIAVTVRIVIDGRTNYVRAAHGDRRKRNRPYPGNRTVQRNYWLQLNIRTY